MNIDILWLHETQYDLWKYRIVGVVKRRVKAFHNISRGNISCEFNLLRAEYICILCR